MVYRTKLKPQSKKKVSARSASAASTAKADTPAPAATPRRRKTAKEKPAKTPSKRRQRVGDDEAGGAGSDQEEQSIGGTRGKGGRTTAGKAKSTARRRDTRVPSKAGQAKGVGGTHTPQKVRFFVCFLLYARCTVFVPFSFHGVALSSTES